MHKIFACYTEHCSNDNMNKLGDSLTNQCTDIKKIPRKTIGCELDNVQNMLNGIANKDMNNKDENCIN